MIQTNPFKSERKKTGNQGNLQHETRKENRKNYKRIRTKNGTDPTRFSRLDPTRLSNGLLSKEPIFWYRKELVNP